MVVGYYDVKGKRHDDSIADTLYVNDEGEVNDSAYTEVIFSVTKESGEEEVIIKPGQRYSGYESLISYRYPIGTFHELYEFKDEYALVNEQYSVDTELF